MNDFLTIQDFKKLKIGDCIRVHEDNLVCVITGPLTESLLDEHLRFGCVAIFPDIPDEDIAPFNISAYFSHGIEKIPLDNRFVPYIESVVSGLSAALKRRTNSMN